MQIKSVIIIILLFLIPKFSFAERITSFDSQMIINQDRSIDVTETIIYDSEGIEKQGIYSKIALDRKFVDSIQVFRDDSPEPILITRDWLNNNLFIRIGQPGIYFKGIRTYTIKYKYDNIITEQNNLDILQHNLNGLNFYIPIITASATIKFPNTLSVNDIVQLQCNIININNTVIDQCVSSKLGEDTVQFTYNNPLFIQNGLELTMKINSGGLNKAPLYSRYDFEIKMVGLLLLVGTSIFTLIWLGWYKNKSIKYESVVQYTPPANLSPAGVGYLRHQRPHPRLISALMISLATQGIVKIKQNFDKKFWQRSKYSFDMLDTEKAKEVKYMGEAMLLEAAFHSYFMANNKFFSDIYLKIEKSEYNRKLFRTSLLIVLATIIYLFVGGGFIVLFCLYIFLEIITQLIFISRNKKLANIHQAVYFEEFLPYHTRLPYYVKILLYTIVVACFLLLFFVLYYKYYLIALTLFVLVIVSLIFLNSIPRRTKLGDEMMAYILGLEEYIVVAEKHRLDFQGKNYLFFELLPYAIALGHENVWSKAFEGIPISNPGWYEGIPTSSVDFSSHWFYRDILNGARLRSDSSILSSLNYNTSKHNSGGGFWGTIFRGGGGFGRGGGGGSW